VLGVLHLVGGDVEGEAGLLVGPDLEVDDDVVPA
jgi:hypothetical protein